MTSFELKFLFRNDINFELLATKLVLDNQKEFLKNGDGFYTNLHTKSSCDFTSYSDKAGLMKLTFAVEYFSFTP